MEIAENVVTLSQLSLEKTKHSSGSSMNNALDALQRQQWSLAAQMACGVLQLHPDLPLAVLVLGMATYRLGHPSALATLARAVALSPNNPQFHFSYARTLAKEGQADLAMVEYRACLELQPDCKEALWAYGGLLQAAGHFARALECFDQLAELEALASPRLAHRMALCCAQLGLNKRADALFKSEMGGSRSDHVAQLHWDYARFLLGCGRIDEAWPHYAHRIGTKESRAIAGAHCDYPQWQGKFKTGATLVVTGEQALGDDILFAGYVPDLLFRARAQRMRVVLVCRPALLRLFEASFPCASVVSSGSSSEILAARVTGVSEAGQSNTPAPPAAACWQIALGSLPLWLPKAAPTSYLRPHGEDVECMRLALARCPTQAGGRRGSRIGIAWGDGAEDEAANRPLACDAPLPIINGLGSQLAATFFNLQSPEGRAALAQLPDLQMHDLGHLLTDFSRVAALMHEMDAVVTACPAIANLAGALGLPARVVLPKHADWRWHGDNVWYPNTRCYRQQIAGDWSVPLHQVFEDLARLPETSHFK
jgi:tetratricopeptide (TPR) repeat protein